MTAYNTRIFAFLLIALCTLTFATADYSFYLEHGGDTGNQHNVLGTLDNEPLGATLGAFPTKGSQTETLVFDANNDGINEIFTQAINNLLSIAQGTTPESSTTFYIGELAINPVACDIDNDGDLDYNAVYDNGTAYVLATIGLTADGGINLLYSLNITFGTTNTQGNLVCEAFYNTEGDTAKYLLWVDNEKYLSIYKPSGSTFTGSRFDVDPDEIGIPTSVTSESTIIVPYGFGSDRTIYSSTFNNDGLNAIVFVAGEILYAYYSDQSVDYYILSSALSTFAPNYNPTTTKKYVELMGDVRDTSTGKTGVLTLFGGDDATATTNGEAPLFLFKHSGGIFGDSIQLVKQTNVPYEGCPATSCSTVTNAVFPAMALKESLSTTDKLSLLTWRVGVTAPLSNSCPVYREVFMNNFSTSLINHATVNASACDNVVPVVQPPRIFSVKLDDDSQNDALFLGIESGSIQEAIFYYSSKSNYTRIQKLASNPVSTTGNDEIYSPVPVDYNNDGLIDLIMSHASLTTFYSAFVPSFATIRDYGFGVVLNNTVNLRAVSLVDIAYNTNSSTIFNYALACGITIEPIWTELFTSGYNFSESNVSTSLEEIYDLDPQDFLSFSGLEVTIGGNITSLSIRKSTEESYREDLSFSFDYTLSGNHTFDVVGTGSDGSLTSYFRYVVNGSNVQVYKVVGEQIFIGQIPQSGNAHTIRITYTPLFDTSEGISYFDVSLYFDDDLVNTTSTVQFEGEDLSSFLIYTNTVGSLIVRSMEFSQSDDLTPNFVQFQNGVTSTQSGVTLTVNAPISQISGVGFTVFTGFNDIFYGVCEYEADGTYTQRHYIAPTNTFEDYSNYRDLIVQVQDGTSTSSDSNGSLSDDPLVALLETFLDGFGFSSTAGKLVFWLVLTGIIAAWLFSVHMMLGIISIPVLLILGALFGFVPFWVVVVMVIFAAGLAAVAFRWVFSGGG